MYSKASVIIAIAAFLVAAQLAFVARPSESRGLLGLDANLTWPCAAAIVERVTAPNATWRNLPANGTQQEQLSQLVEVILTGDQRCVPLSGVNTSKSLLLTWMQYPAWMNGAFTEWIWRLKTDNATAADFTHVLFEGSQQLPPPNIMTSASAMRDYAAAHNDDAMVYSTDLSGFSSSYAVDQKAVGEYVENSCIVKGNPRGILHPRVFLALFYRADILTALHAAGLTPTAAPPDDWEALVALLQAHVAAVAAVNATAAANAAAAGGGSSTGGPLLSEASLATLTTLSGGLPTYGICITMDPACGRAGDLLAAIAASVVQSAGTNQGYVFDLGVEPPAVEPLVNGTAWRYATGMLRQLLQYNAPETSIGASSSAQACHTYSPWFGSGQCMVTIEWDVAFLGMGMQKALKLPGTLAVAPLPGSRVVADPRVSASTAGLVNCSSGTICAVSINHDLLYLTPAGQQAAVVAAANATGATCGMGEVARMEAAAAAAVAAAWSTAAAMPQINRAPYSALYDYYAYINYERFAMYDLGREMSLIQLHMASRVTDERALRQGAIEALRRAAGGNDPAAWKGAGYASTPWWTALGAAAAAASGGNAAAAASLPAKAIMPYTDLGLDTRAVVSYLRTLWHAIHAPNAATDIPSPAMVNWYKWGCSHAAFLLAPSQSGTTGAAAALLSRVFLLVNDAHTPHLVRSVYEVAIGSDSWQGNPGVGPAADVSGSKRTALSTTTLIAVVVSVAVGLLLAGAAFAAVLRMRSRHRDLLGRVQAPRAGQDTTLLISDVQSSTALWEQLPVAVMDATLELHHNTVRHLLPQYDGYESATEGDSFILAFADPASAVAFATACQVALMLQDWPQELLAHPDAQPVLADPQSGEAATQAGVPGSDGRRIGSRSPLPRSLFAKWAPGQLLASRARVAATALRGAGGEAGGGGSGVGAAAPTPGLRGGSMFDMSMYDVSIHSSAFVSSGAGNSGGGLRSMDPYRRHSGPTSLRRQAASGGVTVPVAVDATSSLTFPRPPDRAATAPSPVLASAAPAAESTGTPAGSSLSGGEGLPTKAVAFSGFPDANGPNNLRESSMLPGLSESSVVGVGPREGSILARLAGGGFKKAFGPRPDRNTSNVPAVTAAAMAAAAAAMFAGAGTQWVTKLQEAFPLVPAEEAVGALTTAQVLKSPWVMLPSGRLVLLAYRGLRVRMGIHTGLDDPRHIAFNKVGSAYKYYGPFAETAKCTTEAAPGGLVVLSAQAFARLRNNLAGPDGSPAAAAAGGGASAGAATAPTASRQRNLDAVVVYAGHHLPKVAPPPSGKGAVPAAAAAAAAKAVAVVITGAVGVSLNPATGASAASTPVSPLARVRSPPSGGPMAMAVAAGTNSEGVAFYTAVPTALTCRLALSSPIVSSKVMQLGSLAAPTGCICVAFMYVVGASTLLNDLPGPAARALDQFQRLVCRLLGARGGYLVEGGDGLVLAAFGSPNAAVQWSLDCVAGLKKLDWEYELLGHWLCEEVLSVGLANGDALGATDAATAPFSGPAQGATPQTPSPPPSASSRRSLRRAISRMPSMARLGAKATTTRVLERGLRIKVGLDAGPASHSLNDASGRLSYRGKVMNRASRVAGKAAAGQVVCTDTVWQGCIMPPSLNSLGSGAGWDGIGDEDDDDDESGSDADPGSNLVGVSLGRVMLRGVSTPVELIQCMRAS